MKKTTPIIIGLITAAIMILAALMPFYTKKTIPNIQYVVFAVYAAGIIFSLLLYSRSAAYTGSFGSLFNQGFRCFIVVTLVMIIFTTIFVNMHPEFAQESAVEYRKELIKNVKDRNEVEREKMVEDYKKGFNTGFISRSIFGYLISGVVFTTAGAAGLLLFRRK
jgi:hypothetical protein